MNQSLHFRPKGRTEGLQAGRCLKRKSTIPAARSDRLIQDSVGVRSGQYLQMCSTCQMSHLRKPERQLHCQLGDQREVLQGRCLDQYLSWLLG